MPLNSSPAFIRKPKYVGNKTKKGRISKRMLQENKARQIFRNVYFRKNLCALFCWNNFFEICPFTLLQANIHTTFPFQL